MPKRKSVNANANVQDAGFSSDEEVSSVVGDYATEG